MKIIIKLLILISITVSLYGSRILDYNVYNRKSNVDMVIIFDTPYNGKIRQSIKKSKILIKLQDSYIKKTILKSLSSKLISSLSIQPMNGYTQIVANLKTPLILKASKTSNSHALRLRFMAKPTSPSNNKSNSLSKLPTKKDTDMRNRYYIVSIILFIGILILFLVKRKVTPSQHSKEQKNTLLPNNINNVSIRFQKSIDDKNTVVMLDFLDQSYLVLMGNSNILLDKFTDNKPVSQEDFENILKNRREEVDNFIQIENNKINKSLQAYKERAASMVYEDI